MKTTRLYFIVIVVLAFILWTKSCKNEPETITNEVIKEVMIPIVSDSIVYKTIFKTITKEKIVTDTIVDSELVAWLEGKVKEYRTSKDSLQKEILYLKSVEPKYFITQKNDANIDLTLTGYVSGTIHEITPKYTIKIKNEPKTALLYGGQIGQTKEFNNALFEANLGLKNKKGNVIIIGYDTEKHFKFGFLNVIR